MKTWTVGLLCLVSALVALPGGGMARAGQLPPDQRIITLKGGANPLTVARRHGITLGKMYFNALKGFVGRGPASALKKLEADPDVLRVEKDLVAHAVAQTIPTGVSRIGAPSNPYAAIGQGKKVNVDIAIVDTGIDLTHKDLNVVFNKNFVSGESTTSGQDQNGHGTHVAGIAAALDNTIGVVGVAPGARLWALRVLDASGSGYISDIITALDYVAANSSQISVVNMSLGGQGKIDSFRQAIQSCVSRGVVVVVAAGNSSQDVYGPDGVFGTSDDFIPAAYPECCTVSALADTDGKAGGTGQASSYGPDDTLATFSNYSRSVVSTAPVKSPGAAIDVAAPGVNIYSSYLGGGYQTLSGTSMATPHVTGSVALYVAQYGHATNAAGAYAIRQALVNAAQPQSQWGPANTADPDSNHEGCVYVGGTLPPPGSPSAPSVAITQPAKNAIFPFGTSITFQGTATDSTGGNLAGSLAWTSSLQGSIGSGASFTKVLNPGTHVITASATNSTGTGSASVTITVQPAVTTPPTVTITQPAKNATFAFNASITFKGSATDSNGTNLTSGLAWTSSLQGSIGTGGSFTKVLNPGTHLITASDTNAVGTGSASVTITVQSAAVTPPTVLISQPANNATYPFGASIPFSGSATSASGPSLTGSLAWTSSIDGAIGTGGSFSKVLSSGTHTITASVTDPTNGLTGSASITVTVRSSGGSTQLVVTVTTDKPVYHPSDTPSFTVRVTDGTNPVQGASVNLYMQTPYGAWLSAAGTSDATGTFHAYYVPNPRRDGYGWFYLMATASKQGYSGGNGSVWFLLWY